MARLILHDPLIEQNTVYCTYTYDGEIYKHRFEYVKPLDAQNPTILRLVRWLSAVHALYLYDLDYFTELTAEYPLDASEVAFFEKLVYNGLAEFRQVNHIPMATTTTYSGTGAGVTAESPLDQPSNGVLLLNGGGKDGCVSATLLSDASIPFTWFMQNSSVAQDRVVIASEHPAVKTKRNMDQRRKGGKYHGHRPTSAAIAVSAVITAYLMDTKYVIASNERSANEGNGLVEGVSVNHQYSKSLEFERDLTKLLIQHNVGVTYFSLLRPLHELQIVKIAAQNPRYLKAFTSCNHGYQRGEWCLNCAKCAFILLTFTAISPESVAAIWDNVHALDAPGLRPYVEELLDPAMQKPLECVGTLEECQLAAALILDGPLVKDLSQPLVDLFRRHTGQTRSSDLSSFLGAISSEHAVPESFAVILDKLPQYLTR